MAEEGASSKRDVIEIPVGRYLRAVRHNPWIVSTILLSIVLVVVLIFSFAGGLGGGTVSKGTAGENLISFINAQGNGEATLVSSDKEGGLYKVVVNYQNQDIPVFVTLDGKYLVSDPIPLDDSVAVPAASLDPVEVELGDSPVQGSLDAPVTMVEFSDYECPFCGKYYNEVYSQLKKDYIDSGKVKLVFKDFPLSFHPNAQKAAEAARCVGAQKGDAGYFKMHDLLFENQAELSVENYKKWARTLGVNGATFDKCLDDGTYASAVAQDAAYGQTLGVSGTPAFFINGKILEGAQPYAAFKQMIDAELQAA